MLTNPLARSAYDREGRATDTSALEPGEIRPRPAPVYEHPKVPLPRLSEIPIAIWVGVAVVVLVLGYEVTRFATREPPRPSQTVIRPNAPEPPAGQQAKAAEPLPTPPLMLVGTANVYTIPSPGRTFLWQAGSDPDRLVAGMPLEPFTPLQAIRLLEQSGLVEVRASADAVGFIEAVRLAPGNEQAARRAFCTYHAGPNPEHGEILFRAPGVPGIPVTTLRLANRSPQPAVVKLRDPTGATAMAVFLMPSAEATVDGVPETRYGLDYAIGEIWSRACGTFAGGMRAIRLFEATPASALTPLTIPRDGGTALSERDFDRD